MSTTIRQTCAWVETPGAQGIVEIKNTEFVQHDLADDEVLVKLEVCGVW